jgi:hypothetical protein
MLWPGESTDDEEDATGHLDLLNEMFGLFAIRKLGQRSDEWDRVAGLFALLSGDR